MIFFYDFFSSIIVVVAIAFHNSGSFSFSFSSKCYFLSRYLIRKCEITFYYLRGGDMGEGVGYLALLCWWSLSFFFESRLSEELSCREWGFYRGGRWCFYCTVDWFIQIFIKINLIPIFFDILIPFDGWEEKNDDFINKW